MRASMGLLFERSSDWFPYRGFYEVAVRYCDTGAVMNIISRNEHKSVMREPLSITLTDSPMQCEGEVLGTDAEL